jgi:hypothetical protein
MAREGVRAVGGMLCRGARAFPQTATDKVPKREIVAQAWVRAGPGLVPARPAAGVPSAYRRDIAGIRAEFHRGGRLHLLEQS